MSQPSLDQISTWCHSCEVFLPHSQLKIAPVWYENSSNLDGYFLTAHFCKTCYPEASANFLSDNSDESKKEALNQFYEMHGLDKIIESQEEEAEEKLEDFRKTLEKDIEEMKKRSLEEQIQHRIMINALFGQRSWVLDFFLLTLRKVKFLQKCFQKHQPPCRGDTG